ncbi:MAG TPA: TIGR03118 family protein [Rhizomicrobium sp.]|nr:TIGR03118 family protein [Rhizomicrobium sp.]
MKAPDFARNLPVAALLLAGAALATPAVAQYKLVSLAANEKDLGHNIPAAPNIDSRISNAWSLAWQAKGPFWVSDELTGYLTVYTPDGKSQPTVVSVPNSASDPLPPGSPAGLAANLYGGFSITQNGVSEPAEFIIATVDGTLQGWNPKVNKTSSVIALDNGTEPAAYTDLQIDQENGSAYLYAVNAYLNQIEKYDSNWNLVKTFGDPNQMFGVYGLSVIQGDIYVTFGPEFPGKPGAGGLDEFDTNGDLIKTLVSASANGPLNIPFAVVLAPSNFGTYSNDLLVGNLQSGLIQAFDPSSGKFLGSVSDTKGKPIAVPGIWDMDFGGGDVKKNGKTDELYFVAGPDTYWGGMLGKIVPDIP